MISPKCIPEVRSADGVRFRNSSQPGSKGSGPSDSCSDRLGLGILGVESVDADDDAEVRSSGGNGEREISDSDDLSDSGCIDGEEGTDTVRCGA